MDFFQHAHNELERATIKHSDLSSLHEAYAVILEEVDELKAEVWKQEKNRDYKAIYNELVQIAAMCARTVQDLRLEPDQPKWQGHEAYYHTIGFNDSAAMFTFLETSPKTYDMKTIDLSFDYHYCQVSCVSTQALTPAQCSSIAAKEGVCYLHLNAVKG